MSREPIDLSRGNGKTVLEQLLEKWELDYMKLSDLLGIKRETLWRYRSGQHDFRLSMKQIKILEDLLGQVGLRLKDLPEDWILDNPKRQK